MENDKLYQWLYSLDTNKLTRQSLDIDTNYQGMYEKGDYVRVLFTNINGDDASELIKSAKIETEFEAFKMDDENYIRMFSYSDDPCHAMELIRNYLFQVYEEVKQNADLAKKWLADATMKKADINLKYGEGKESEKEKGDTLYKRDCIPNEYDLSEDMECDQSNDKSIKYAIECIDKLEKIEEIVNCELIAGRRNYKSCYNAFYEIVDVIQDRD